MSLCGLSSNAISLTRPVCSLGLVAVVSSGADPPGWGYSPERSARPSRFSGADLGKGEHVLTMELRHLTVQVISTSKKGEQ